LNCPSSQPALLGVLAKWPRPGEVKTRLAAATSPKWAAELAQACLQDLLQQLSRINVQRVLFYAPATAVAEFAALAAPHFGLRPQAEGDLGQRMQSILARSLAEGAERVVLVGSDSPTVPLEYLSQAFAELEWADVVLGPATDGGYYLIGVARRVPPLFDGIQWSNYRVLRDTVNLITTAKLRLSLLPPWYDVDTLADCQMLRGHLCAQRAAGIDPQVPHVEALLNAAAW
jgi:rSAM/selenodomain-associated transferase 1